MLVACWFEFFDSLEDERAQRLGLGRTEEEVAETPCDISKVPAERKTRVGIPTSGGEDDDTPRHGSPGPAFVAHGSVFIEESDGEDDLPTLRHLIQRSALQRINRLGYSRPDTIDLTLGDDEE
ncbi:hypothetical protein N0V84_001443 [Fusarium piperis]|uniref:Uncharacterized protein n=1 Tax=Fusarium piperis TaxID=1435070 RepID=A0A9W8WL74_9HYPO|nr:hypothetical protein N0V84_001443 [Fusarium piperis]